MRGPLSGSPAQGQPVRRESRLVKKKDKLVVLDARALSQDDDTVVTECRGRFVFGGDPGLDGVGELGYRALFRPVHEGLGSRQHGESSL